MTKIKIHNNPSDGLIAGFVKALLALNKGSKLDSLIVMEKKGFYIYYTNDIIIFEADSMSREVCSDLSDAICMLENELRHL